HRRDHRQRRAVPRVRRVLPLDRDAAEPVPRLRGSREDRQAGAGRTQDHPGRRDRTRARRTRHDHRGAARRGPRRARHDRYASWLRLARRVVGSRTPALAGGDRFTRCWVTPTRCGVQEVGMPGVGRTSATPGRDVDTTYGATVGCPHGRHHIRCERSSYPLGPTEASIKWPSLVDNAMRREPHWPTYGHTAAPTPQVIWRSRAGSAAIPLPVDAGTGRTCVQYNLALLRSPFPPLGIPWAAGQRPTF